MGLVILLAFAQNVPTFCQAGIVSFISKTLVYNPAPQKKHLVSLLFPPLNVQAYEFVELFAGKGLTSAALRGAGFGTASLDIDYHVPPEGKQNYMDILTSAGLAFLVSFEGNPTSICGLPFFEGSCLKYVHLIKLNKEILMVVDVGISSKPDLN